MSSCRPADVLENDWAEVKVDALANTTSQVQLERTLLISWGIKSGQIYNFVCSNKYKKAIKLNRNVNSKVPESQNMLIPYSKSSTC